MDKPQEVINKEPALERFLTSEKGQEILSQIIEAVRLYNEAKVRLTQAQIESQTNTTRGTAKSLLLWSGILATIVIAPVALLTWYDKLSSDAAAFLIGAIVGAAFTFLRGFFPRGS